MTQARISVVFGNETISVDGVEKRIPLRLPHLLKIKRLDWFGASHSGSLLFNDKRELQFSDADIVVPFLRRWEAEPAQPDVAKLKRYIDEITTDPADTGVLTSRRRWAEIEKRHVNPIYPAALLQFLNTQYAAVDDLPHYRRGEVFSKGRKPDTDLIRALLKDGEPSMSRHQENLSAIPKFPGRESALQIRERERRRFLDIRKK